MTSDYEAIRVDNLRRYGTDVGVYGKTLLEDRYDDRTHFLFELLQNAEDAYARRDDDPLQASVRFILQPTMLDVRHFGVEFTERDVRGVCGIGQSTKDPQEIGKFGIGFKSVYAYTERPEIRSGDEAFAIEDYVLPHTCEPAPLARHETSICLPFRSDVPGAGEEILAALKDLGSSALLFLRRIKEISWDAGGTHSGDFLRDEDHLDDFATIVTIIGQDSERPSDTDEDWLLFRRRAEGSERDLFVEVAFALDRSDPAADWRIRQRSQSRLTVFVPTAVDTHCGVAIQGPYDTTPSRDNVKRSDPWNQALVTQTATVIVDALRWLRDAGKLTPAVLQCLPIRSDAYEGDGGRLFAPLYQAVLEAIRSEPLLPTHDGGFVAAEGAVIGTRDLRALLSRGQLSHLLGSESAWLSEGITEDRTADLYNYLTRAAEVRALTPEFLIPRLTREFLEEQDDDWVRSLYEFLGGLSLGRTRLESRPLVRLADGSHLPAVVNGKVAAYLPGDSTITGFPLVKREVVLTEESRRFVQEKLGLTEPDPVEDVIRHVLPKYRREDIDATEYEEDLQRICHAASSDSTSRRARLIEALGTAYFVRAVDLGTDKNYFAQPGQVYLPTQRIRTLFAGVTAVLVLDDSTDALAGEDVRKLIREAGALDYLRPMERRNRLSREEMAALSDLSGLPRSSGAKDVVVDWDIAGLDGILEVLPTLPESEQSERSALLWEALRDLEHNRSQGVFSATYRWSYYGNHSTEFTPRFLEQLANVPWVYVDGGLHVPDSVMFEDTGWREHPFLQSKIRFKPPIIDELALHAGFEPEMLDLLKLRGIRTVDDLRQLLPDEPEEAPEEADAAPSEPAHADPTEAGDEDDDQSDSEGGPDVDSTEADSSTSLGTRDLLHWDTEDEAAMEPVGSEHSSTRTGGGSGASRKQRNRVRGTRTIFHSFVGVWHDDVDADPDSAIYEERMALEDAAIGLILRQEPDLVRMPAGNPGYDLEERDRAGKLLRVVEVKALRVPFDERPAAISSAQFEAAQRLGAQFWLYIVERAGQPDAKVIRIHDPIAQASYFSFDKGWTQVATQGLTAT